MLNADDRSSTSGLPIRSNQSEAMRSKNKKRDDAIRKKVELELTRRTNRKRSSGLNNSNSAKTNKGTVSSLKPNPAVIILESAKIIQAAQLMAAKRTDAVLAVSDQGDLVGILTDKDIAFRVVAEGLDVRSVSVADVMTQDPIAVFDKGGRNEALNIMVSRRFRHLPVISEGDDEDGGGTSVVGLLDITKCVFERLDDLERKVHEDRSIISAMEVLERRGTVNSERIDTLRNEHECPDVATVIDKVNQEMGDFPNIGVKSSVRDAAKAMKSYHGTAVLVMGTPDGDDRVAGIFTTKDIVLRVIAASLDPSTTSTPHPDFVSSDTSILDALKKLHAGHFLHLPVIDGVEPVGLIDISKSGAAPEQGEEGPMWNTFWNSTFAPTQGESDQQSQISDSLTNRSSSFREHRPQEKYYENRHETHNRIQQLRNEMASPDSSVQNSALSFYSKPAEDSFSFKLKDMTTRSGKIYRFSSQSSSLLKLYENVCLKTGYGTAYSAHHSDTEHLDIITHNGTRARLNYLDDEGDIVALENNMDVQEAVQMAIAMGSNRLMIYLGDPPGSHPNIHQNPISTPGSIRSASPLNRRSQSPYSRFEDRRIPNSEPHNLFDALKDAPLSVNVAISAGIVVVSFYLLTKIAKMK
ncbi:hypothetical protein HDV02_004384 [Globomyces sp. JEL0801]|nr:hypothetical protein HDV02_004384 [Globomyces sp. JEL0801]